MKQRFCRLLAGLLASVFLLAGCGSAPPEPDPVPIIPPAPGETVRLDVATDLHLITPALVQDGESFRAAYESGDGKQINYISQITDAFLAQVIAEKPNALILTGDLSLDGEKKSHEDLAARLERVRRAGIPVFVIPGNHDINNSYAAGFKKNKKYNTPGIDPQEFAQIYQNCGYGDAVSRDETTLSYLAQISPDLWLVMLDTNIYDVKAGMSLSPVGGSLSAETLSWLERCLQDAEEAGATVISATHHNLVDHSDRINKNYTLDNAQEVLDLYDRYGVVVNLSGHIHVQSIAASQRENHGIFDIATSSLAVYTNQYGQLTVEPGKRISYHTQEVDVEGWATQTGSEDENLLHFEDYSYRFFYDLSFARSLYNLYMDQVPADDAQVMAQTMALLNPVYFSGTVGEIREEILASDHYALWKKKGAMVSYEYNESMLKVPDYDPRRVEIPLS